ncbi:hypothetical protein BV22DRAFT_298940 [Leucogyrophana mollusca]|uniref:Uncharacterized protein n=1 Tax=Leucogyrophana mollusca TaxID=85980 RepID=A0ACB8BMQ6_9AGAM|nr:hypothetical protein BV22DRAFT_298940 [Leucogyrophana mollusca]
MSAAARLSQRFRTAPEQTSISLSPKTKSVASTLFKHFIILSTAINYLCVSIVLFYLGTKYPEIGPYAYIAGLYVLYAKGSRLVVAFAVSAWWHIFKLVAPNSAGGSLKEWADQQKARRAAGKPPNRWLRVNRLLQPAERNKIRQGGIESKQSPGVDPLRCRLCCVRGGGLLGHLLSRAPLSSGNKQV